MGNCVHSFTEIGLISILKPLIALTEGMSLISGFIPHELVMCLGIIYSFVRAKMVSIALLFSKWHRHSILSLREQSTHIMQISLDQEVNPVFMLEWPGLCFPPLLQIRSAYITART